MKTKESFFISILLVFILVILQSTLFYFAIPNIVIPDFALIVVAFCGARRGMQEGQVLGFLNGLAEDFMTASFPGFNALVKTLIGFLAGTIKNKMLFDPVIFPSLFILFVTLLKGILATVTAYLFFPEGYFPAVFSSSFLLEIVLNSLFAPLIYLILKKTHLIPDDIWSGK
ncbi:MAG: rod shape-determining protein MreD [Spirochaetia bacterium]|nr:rod shape-determining protein MreD [Spirochaetia bacterium]MBR4436749.1 rod shape-determining protein MreD [Spirochaetales bacterium]MBR4797567.1 rod shape-determining protein MreD [Spirochaetia bacterium]MBR5016602.1 rod shape-determining protein MreD [Spirochaetia bacterium]MBR5926825.1 rod shape-determining protein MreD [Spirochaetia bacterium]